jgi:nucleoside-diphosphate-sugar epimerase
VHRLDAAGLFRLALENAAPAARVHGVAEEGVTLRALAKVIGEGLGVPVQSIAED